MPDISFSVEVGEKRKRKRPRNEVARLSERFMKKNQGSRSIKKDFPIVGKKINGKPLVFLDSASTSQKPRQVLEKVREFYENYNANIHRGVYAISEKATEEYEHVRTKVADLIGAQDPQEIVFTRGTTESVNLVAYTWGEANVKRGDNIVTTIMEHHSNFVPWQEVCKKKGAQFRVAPITKHGVLDLPKLYHLVDKRTKLVAFTHASNMLGTIHPAALITRKIKTRNKNVTILIDGAQAVPHLAVDVQKLGCDFYVFSGHKMLAPTGVGVLWARKELLEEMPPFLTGGHMIIEVTTKYARWNDVPYKFEAGTQHIAGVIGLGAAIDYLTILGMAKVRQHEMELTRYAFSKLLRFPGIEIYGPTNIKNRTGVISFNIRDIHSHDLASFLDEKGIAIRAGHHCTMPLHREALGIEASARVSFYIYNTKEEIDRLVEGLYKAKKILA